MLDIGKRILDGENVNLCFFGDSITEGCFEFNDDFSDTTFKPELSYPYKLQKLIKDKLKIDVTIINAGKSGSNTVKALKRFDNDVLNKKPDFCLVMFGSNDVVNIYWKQFAEDVYFENMKYIFNKLRENNIEVACMSPSMMAMKDKGTLVNTKFQETLTSCIYLQTNGIVDTFFNKLKTMCTDMDVPYIDVYAIWKGMDSKGIDITDLLCNDVNHPNEDMHNVFAKEIYNTIFE